MVTRKKKIVIAGFADASRNSRSQYFARAAIAQYVHELSSAFDECVWITYCEHDQVENSCLIDHERVQVIPFNPKISCAIKNLFMLVRQLNSDVYLILHLPSMLTLAWASPLFRVLSKRFFVYIGSDYEKVLLEFNAKWLGWKQLYRLIHELSMKVSHCVIARGKYLGDLAKSHNRNVVETVPIANMSPCSLQSSSKDKLSESPKHSLHILYIGTLRVSKGLNDLMDALEILYLKDIYKKSPHLVLDVVGDGPDVEKFKQRADSLKCSNHIYFHGWIGNKAEIDTFFSQAQVLVVPSSTHPEGVPRVIDEALMHQVPVISTKVGGIEEEFTNNEILLTEPSNPDALASALEKILFDAEARNFHIKASKSRVIRWKHYRSAGHQHSSLLLDKPIVKV